MVTLVSCLVHPLGTCIQGDLPLLELQDLLAGAALASEKLQEISSLWLGVALSRDSRLLDLFLRQNRADGRGLAHLWLHSDDLGELRVVLLCWLGHSILGHLLMVDGDEQFAGSHALGRVRVTRVPGVGVHVRA